jgi:hypothetical protein
MGINYNNLSEQDRQLITLQTQQDWVNLPNATRTGSREEYFETRREEIASDLTTLANLRTNTDLLKLLPLVKIDLTEGRTV